MRLSKKGKILLLLLGLFTLLPLLMLTGFGLYYIYLLDLILYFVIFSLVLFTILQLLMLYFEKERVELFEIDRSVEPSRGWSSFDLQVYEEFVKYARDLDKSNFEFDNKLPNRFLNLSLEITKRVSKKYHPNSKNPELEVTLPFLLQVSELTIKEIREEIVEKIPLSHTITLNHFLKVPRLIDLYSTIGNSYRVTRFAINPAVGVVSEIKGYVASRILNYSKRELLSWLVEFYIKKVAKYTVDLYSGNFRDRESNKSFEEYLHKSESKKEREPKMSTKREEFWGKLGYQLKESRKFVLKSAKDNIKNRFKKG